MRGPLLSFLLCLTGGVAALPGAEPTPEVVPDSAAKEPTLRLLELARQAELTDLDRAWSLAKEARATARGARAELQADLVVAGLQRQRGDYAGALALARAGVERAKQAGERTLEAEFLLLVARTQWNRSELPASLETYQVLLPQAGAVGDPDLLARVHNGLANTQATSGHWERALAHYEIAREFATKGGDRATLADILNNLANFHHNRRKDYETARRLHTEALALREAIGHKRGIADSQLNLGNIADASGNFAEAIAQFERARAVYEELGLKRNLANALRALGTALRRTGRAEEGLVPLQRARALAEELGSPGVLAPVFRELAATHEAMGDWRTALEHERRHFEANESMLGERTRQQIVALNERADAERHERQVALLRREQAVQQAELAQARYQRFGLLAVIGFGAIAVVAVISRQRLKLAAERRVLEQTRAAKEAAERADALKTRLVGIASHDLKSPVRGIVTAAELMHAEPENTRQVAALAGRVRDEGARMFGLISELLDFAALEKGRLVLQRAPLDARTLVCEIVEALQSRAQGKRQMLVAQVDPPLRATVSGDAGRLRQAVENLVDNALKFTPEHGRIEVAMRTDSTTVQIAITDQGPGLAPEDYARLFQPFQTLSALSTAGEPSSGLGLFIAHELVTAHGGRIVVDSIPGNGATFTVLLPRHA